MRGDAISRAEIAQAAKAVGAHPIVGVDVNAKKFDLAKQLGATDCINPKDHDGTPMQQARPWRPRRPGRRGLSPPCVRRCS